MEMPESAKGIKFNPLLEWREDGSIRRKCQFYPDEYQFHGEWNCYGCDKRTQCNANLFDRLAAYEMSKLSPEVVMNYKTFEDEVIAAGLSFKDVLAVIEQMKREKGG